MILDKTYVLKVKSDLSGEGDKEKLLFAAEVIHRGGLVAFPTETVYGLGANALDEDAVRSIFTAKGRPQDNPLIVHLSHKKEIFEYAQIDWDTPATKLTDCMPAPLTIVLPKKDTIPDVVTAGLENAGFRVPQNKVARHFLKYCKIPVAAPSANLSGKPSPTRAEHVIADMMGRIDVIIDGGDCEVGVESTVISMCGEVPLLLRPGGFTYEMLTKLLGRVDIAPAVLAALEEGQRAESPGMKYKHYAPDTKVILVKGGGEKLREFLNNKYNKENCGIICFDEDLEAMSDRVIFMGSRSDDSVFAEKMFDALRNVDNIPSIDRVYATLPEDISGIRLAIYNRLLRAAEFNVIYL